MLTSLFVQNVVLIDRLTLEAESGLCALTGETGAGKSILLEAMGLALGAKADAKLVRHNELLAVVTASFDIGKTHPVRRLLAEKDIDISDGTLVLRRTVGADGRSKAFANDTAVSVQFLKEIGQELVEIHGQFETQGLLDPASHRRTLDAYAGVAGDVTTLRGLWDEWRQAQAKIDGAIAEAEALRLQEDYLKHAVAELEKLAPEAGEEKTLAEKRSFLLNREKMAETFEQAVQLLDGEEGAAALLGRLQGLLEKLRDKGGDAVLPLLETLSRATGEVSELSYQIGRLQSGRDGEGDNLTEIEERYFALKECAKKHRCTTDDLPRVHEEMAQKLKLVTHQDEALEDLRKALAKAKAGYIALAEEISVQRQKFALKLAKAASAELPALKLEKAKFSVECVREQDENSWHAEGLDTVRFLVATNPAMPAGSLNKIASGGELARFMLALKVVLADAGSVPTLIFDEVDSGIGGAVAEAVGVRLSQLGRKYQVLVVTHSPQVAAQARHHWVVSKASGKGAALTKITPLKSLTTRAEEIARMLSGAQVTAEARAQAARLLENHDAAA